MNRTVTLLLLTAMLMAGLGWFFDRDDAADANENPDTLAANSSVDDSPIPLGAETSASAEPDSPASAFDRTDLELEGPETQVAPFLGPTKLLELNIHGRTSEYYLAPPAAGLKIDVFYGARAVENSYTYQKLENAKPLGQILLDAEGKAKLKIELPANQAEEHLLRSVLYLVPSSQNWQSSMAEVYLNSRISQPLEKKLVFLPGATITVRAIGEVEGPGQSYWSRSLRVIRTDTKADPLSSTFRPKHNDGSGPVTAKFGLVEKGTYRISASFPSGVGLLPEVKLDPTSPPQELTILIGEFGTISGKLLTPYGKSDDTVSIVAFPADYASDDGLDIFNTQYPTHLTEAFPPRTRSSAVEKNGSFHISGLAPGSYRLGYRIFSFPTSYYGWFSSAPVTSGSENVTVELPTTLIVLEFRNAQGEIFNKAPKGLEVKLEQLSKKTGTWSHELDQERSALGILGYPIFQGGAYRLTTWGADFDLFEKTFEGAFPPGVWKIEIPIQQVEYGRMEWTGPTKDVSYKVQSAALGHEIYSWSSWGYSRNKEKAVALPPGRYLLIATGHNHTGRHGEVGDSRTPFGEQRQWFEVVANQTTQVNVELPSVGWISVNLQATGQLNPDLLSQDAFPTLTGVKFRDFTYSENQASFVLTNLITHNKVALSFQEWIGGSGHRNSYLLHPGNKESSLDVFSPGNYELEVRVPGFPLQRIPVTIQAKKWSNVQVMLQGI